MFVLDVILTIDTKKSNATEDDLLNIFLQDLVCVCVCVCVFVCVSLFLLGGWLAGWQMGPFTTLLGSSARGQAHAECMRFRLSCCTCQTNSARCLMNCCNRAYLVCKILYQFIHGSRLQCTVCPCLGI